MSHKFKSQIKNAFCFFLLKHFLYYKQTIANFYTTKWNGDKNLLGRNMVGLVWRKISSSSVPLYPFHSYANKTIDNTGSGKKIFINDNDDDDDSTTKWLILSTPWEEWAFALETLCEWWKSTGRSSRSVIERWMRCD